MSILCMLDFYVSRNQTRAILNFSNKDLKKEFDKNLSFENNDTNDR